MKNSFVVIAAPSLVLITALIILLFSISLNRSEIQISIHPAAHYPRWLEANNYNPTQTSGITLLFEDAGKKIFLLADDIGKIHRFVIKNDTIFSFTEIRFSNELNNYLAEFPKKDFEEIFYDKYTDEVYLTIEGNGKAHLRFHGIYKMKFLNDDVQRDTITSLEKIHFVPEAEFFKNLLPNIGYEGFTADENYFYLGLENIQSNDGEFSNKTAIRIADKKSLKIIKEISTDSLNISTICGLYSDKNYSLWGIDRNHRKVFKLKLDEYFNIVDLDFFEIITVVPGYKGLEYTGSLESITITSEKFLFMVDDPWYAFFIPPGDILAKLDSNTVNNFKNFIPIIYKFIIE